MVDFVNAIKKPFSDLQKLVIGIIIGLIPIVNFLLVGYGIRTAQATIKGDQKLPEWFTDFGDLIAKSILGVVIEIIYFIIPLVVFLAGLLVAGGSFIGTLFSVFSGSTLLQNPAVIQSFITALFTAGAFILIALILLLIVAYILPAALILFARENSFSAAFNLSKVLSNAFSLNYFVSALFIIAFSIVMLFIAIIVGLIPIIGIFIAAGLVNFTMSVLFFTVFAEAVKK